MANRTPPSQWGNLFNFAGGGLVHNELFALLIVSILNPTLFEAIAHYILPFGPIADRPAIADVPEGSLYFPTDETKIYQAQEGSWEEVGGSEEGGGSGTLGGASVYHNTTQNVPNNTPTVLAFNSELYDSDSYHDNSTNNSRLTVPATGFYLINATFEVNQYTAWPTTNIYLRLNGTTEIGINQQRAAQNFTQIYITLIIALDSGDYIEILALQDSGSTLPVDNRGTITPMFQIERLR